MPASCNTKGSSGAIDKALQMNWLPKRQLSVRIYSTPIYNNGR